jgi:hypothetical protein
MYSVIRLQKSERMNERIVNAKCETTHRKTDQPQTVSAVIEPLADSLPHCTIERPMKKDWIVQLLDDVKELLIK